MLASCVELVRRVVLVTFCDNLLSRLLQCQYCIQDVALVHNVAAIKRRVRFVTADLHRPVLATE